MKIIYREINEGVKKYNEQVSSFEMSSGLRNSIFRNYPKELDRCYRYVHTVLND